MCQIVFGNFAFISSDERDEFIHLVRSGFQNVIDYFLRLKGEPSLKQSGGLIWINNQLILDKDLKKIVDLINERAEIEFIYFNRMTPETENSENWIPQPYVNIYDKTVFAVHGLISNAEELAEKYNIKINVDTDIFALIPSSEIFNMLENNEIEGKYVVVSRKPGNSSIEVYNNSGLGIWKVDIPSMLNKFGSLNMIHERLLTGLNIFTMTRITEADQAIMNCRFKLTNNIRSKIKTIKREPKIAIALVSGGLDITASIFEYRKNNPETKIIGLFFDYGQPAAKKEFEAANKILEKGWIDELYNLDIKNFFQNLLVITNQESRLVNSENTSGAGIQEAESNLSYVPSRNSYFANIALNYFEQKFPNERTLDIIIGANMSEAMTYNDNSEMWGEKLSEALALSGKEKIDVKIQMPFVNKTKTEYLKYIKNEYGDEALKEILNTSFSCYFPNKDGNPCGECGSCLLRKKAIERIENE